MSGFRPVDPKQSFPELELGVLERWRADRHVRAPARASAARPGRRSGASTTGRRPRTASPAPTTSSRARSRTSIRATGRCAATTSRARPAGTATGSRSSSRSRRSSGSRRRPRSRSTGSREFNQRCRESVLRYVEDWNRLTERIGFWIDLDDPYVTMTNDYIESVWWSLRQDLGRRPPLRGPQGRPLLPALRHGAVLARGRAGLRGRRGPLRLRALPGHRGPADGRDPRAAGRGRRLAGRLDDHAVDPDLQRRARRGRGHRVRARARRRRGPGRGPRRWSSGCSARTPRC